MYTYSKDIINQIIDKYVKHMVNYYYYCTVKSQNQTWSTKYMQVHNLVVMETREGKEAALIFPVPPLQYKQDILEVQVSTQI